MGDPNNDTGDAIRIDPCPRCGVKPSIEKEEALYILSHAGCVVGQAMNPVGFWTRKQGADAWNFVIRDLRGIT